MVQLTPPRNARMTTGRTWDGLARARVAWRKHTFFSAAASVRTVVNDDRPVPACALSNAIECTAPQSGGY